MLLGSNRSFSRKPCPGTGLSRGQAWNQRPDLYAAGHSVDQGVGHQSLRCGRHSAMAPITTRACEEAIRRSQQQHLIRSSTLLTMTRSSPAREPSASNSFSSILRLKRSVPIGGGGRNRLRHQGNKPRSASCRSANHSASIHESCGKRGQAVTLPPAATIAHDRGAARRRPHSSPGSIWTKLSRSTKRRLPTRSFSCSEKTMRKAPVQAAIAEPRSIAK